MTIEANIYKAVFENDVELTRVCVLDAGIHPNMRSATSGHTPLQVACEANSLDAMEELLKLGADPNFRFTKKSVIDGHIIGAEDGVALMHVNSVAAADILIRYGADADLMDKNGLTAKDWAARYKNADLVAFFERLG